MNQQLVLVDLDDSEPFVWRFISDEPISLEIVKNYCEDNIYKLDWEEDSITFIEDIEDVKL